MIDIKLIRNNPEIIKKDLQKRDKPNKIKELDKVIEMDLKWRMSLQEVQELKKQKNIISEEINELKKQGKNAEIKLNLVKNISHKIKSIDDNIKKNHETIIKILMNLPNILHDSVPIGIDDTQNKVEKLLNKKPKFNFTPKSHANLIEKNNLADIKRAAKISGARWYFLLGDLTMLDFALQKYALDYMSNKGYMPISPPSAMNRKAYEGSTDLADFEDVMYKIENDDLYLIATSEHPLTARFMNEVIENDDLPMKFAGISPCYRKEAGSHGKDTKGLFRVHQFNKIEQIVICKPEDSWKYHEEIMNNAIELFTSLGFHFRIVNVCTGDMGTVASKKYDLEVWMPVQNTYREMVSCSNCTDYQTRRLNIKYRTKEGNEFLHTLNSTAIATTRVLVAIIENFQDKDGNIHIPKVLHPYMNGVKIIKAKN